MSDVQVEGLYELQINFKRNLRNISSVCEQALKKGGMMIIAESQKNLRINKTNNTGMLSQSGKVTVDKDGVEAGFYGSENQAGYAEFVEYGRRAGRMPPVKMLQEWARKKLRLDAKTAKTAGFLISRSIGKKGTKPHPFFVPAVNKISKDIVRNFENEIRREL